METKNIIGIILTVTVGIICIGTVMMPILTDAAASEDTFTNDGLYRMTKYDTTAEFTAVWDYTDPYIITIGDEEVALPETSSYLMTMTGNDGYLARMGVVSSATGFAIQVYDSTSKAVRIYASEGDYLSMTITVSAGTVTFDNGTSTYSVTYDDSMLFISNDGAYVMKNADDTAYVNGDSDFYGIGITKLTVGESSSTNFALYLIGNIDDGFTVAGINGTISSDNHVITKTTYEDHIDLYGLSEVSFTAVYTDETTTTDYETAVSYSQIIVPYEVTAERTVHFDDSQATIIMLIPVLIILALMMVAVKIVTRYD